MKPSCSRRRALRYCSGLLITGGAGCLTAIDTGTKSPTGTRTATPDPAGDRCASYTPEGTSSAGYDIGLMNDDNDTHTVTLRVDLEASGGADPILEREYTLGPGETNTETCIPFTEPGTYTVSVAVSEGRTATFEWKVERVSGTIEKALFVTVEDDSTISFDWFYV
ncbi:hypothetical protein [Haloarchaeobius sp. DYHT-AS-18]|uniref:hypothetical protein n=1 Tax=Haloarchaeobius sp. DYHT-AS-18 TaxID=3446117 RepID=UPI003EBDB443